MDLMDIRLRERLLRKGVITQEQVDKYQKALHDLTARAEFVDYETKFQEEVDDDDDSDRPQKVPLTQVSHPLDED